MVWRMLDRLGRPPLWPRLHREALELNRHALALVRGGVADAERARALLTTTGAAAACWHLLRPHLTLAAGGPFGAAWPASGAPWRS